jgi:hypothetical protein
VIHFVACRWRRAGLRVLTVGGLTFFSILASSAFAGAASGLRVSASPEIDNWNKFYATDIEAAYRFLGAFIVIGAVLFAASGLVSGMLVGVSAGEWNRAPLRITRVLGTVLILTAAAFLPLYAMFHPFLAADVVHIWAWAVLLGLYAVMFVLFMWSQRGPGPWHFNEDALENWWPFLLSLVVISVACAILWFFGLNSAQPRLVMSYIALLLLSVITTSVSYGQSSRIQIEAKAGNGKAKRDGPSTEYLLARIKTLGLEQPHSLRFARNSKAFSALNSTDLSATPAGQIGSVIARVVFALRPGLTWHATVTFVDDGRLAMMLSRNGRLAAADAFSRRDVSLSPIKGADHDSIDRARAQLLTGAAAFVLLKLAEVYPRLRQGLCGATRWRSIALQVIASSNSLSGDAENPLALLRLAANLDPGNRFAQYEYIRALAVEYEQTEFNESTAMRLDELAQAIMSENEPGYAGLKLRILYDSAVDWLTIAARSSGQQRERSLQRAAASVTSLKDLCRSQTVTSVPDLKQIAEILESEADCLESNIGAFTHDEAGDRPAKLSPALAYNYACFEARRLTLPGTNGPARNGVLDLLFHDLSFALTTKETKAYARKDPFFDGVRDEPRFIALVDPAPTEFLDLAPYRRFKSKLADIGYDSAPLFAAANTSPQQREETAKYLKVPSATILRMYELATIGAIDPAVVKPGLLHLLIELNVASMAQLRKELTPTSDGFLMRLREKAAEYGLANLSGVSNPYGWLGKVVAQTDTDGTYARDRSWSLTVGRLHVDGGTRTSGS